MPVSVSDEASVSAMPRRSVAALGSFTCAATCSRCCSRCCLCLMLPSEPAALELHDAARPDARRSCSVSDFPLAEMHQRTVMAMHPSCRSAGCAVHGNARVVGSTHMYSYRRREAITQPLVSGRCNLRAVWLYAFASDGASGVSGQGLEHQPGVANQQQEGSMSLWCAAFRQIASPSSAFHAVLRLSLPMSN